MSAIERGILCCVHYTKFGRPTTQVQSFCLTAQAQVLFYRGREWLRVVRPPKYEASDATTLTFVYMIDEDPNAWMYWVRGSQDLENTFETTLWMRSYPLVKDCNQKKQSRYIIDMVC